MMTKADLLELLKPYPDNIPIILNAKGWHFVVPDSVSLFTDEATYGGLYAMTNKEDSEVFVETPIIKKAICIYNSMWDS
jgi:hypothetical protein